MHNDMDEKDVGSEGNGVPV